MSRAELSAGKRRARFRTSQRSGLFTTVSELEKVQPLPPIVWDESVEVGHPILDKQHRHIVDLVNALHRAAQGEGLASVGLVLPYLVRFLQNHFDTEEAILRQVAYPGVERHAVEHRALLTQVTSAVAAAKDGHDTDLVVFAATIWSLVHQHTVISDQEYAPLLRTLSGTSAPDAGE